MLTFVFNLCIYLLLDRLQIFSQYLKNQYSVKSICMITELKLDFNDCFNLVNFICNLTETFQKYFPIKHLALWS